MGVEWRKEKGMAYVINISGDDVEDIPTLVLRKKCVSPIRMNTLNNGRIKIKKLEKDRYCSFLLDKNKRFILNDGNEIRALEYVKKIIKEIKERKISLNELIIKTQLKKPLDEYKAITPHVIAARKMKESGIPTGQGELIEFYISDSVSSLPKSKQLIRDKVKLIHEEGKYDIEYYLKNQILPAVENIFQVFGINVNEFIDGKKQMKLGEF